jgi:hypothetical protein
LSKLPLPSIKVHADPDLPPGRIVVDHDGVRVAMGTIGNMECIRAAVTTAGADIYLHPDYISDFKAWQIADAERKRRLN